MIRWTEPDINQQNGVILQYQLNLWYPDVNHLCSGYTIKQVLVQGNETSVLVDIGSLAGVYAQISARTSFPVFGPPSNCTALPMTFRVVSTTSSSSSSSAIVTVAVPIAVVLVVLITIVIVVLLIILPRMRKGRAAMLYEESIKNDIEGVDMSLSLGMSLI